MSFEEIRFSQMYTCGDHYHRSKGERAEIRFENLQTGTKRVIVDDSGRIQGFPGIAHRDLISKYSDALNSEQIRYPSRISLLGQQYALIWQIQPDGRYWEDDGFGATSEDEIKLYARLDEEGCFVEPFRLYSIGRNQIYGTDAEKQLLHRFHLQEDPVSSMYQHIPDMISTIREKLRYGETCSVDYLIPGTVYQATLCLIQDDEFWVVEARMAKQYSDYYLLGWLKYLPLEEQIQYLNTGCTVEAEKKLVYLLQKAQEKGAWL